MNNTKDDEQIRAAFYAELDHFFDCNVLTPIITEKLYGQIVAYLCDEYNIDRAVLNIREGYLYIVDYKTEKIDIDTFLQFKMIYDQNPALVCENIVATIKKIFAKALYDWIKSIYDIDESAITENKICDVEVYDKQSKSIANCEETKAADIIKSCLLNDNNSGVLIYGKSSSGKTVSTLQACKYLTLSNTHVLWYDLSMGTVSACGIAVSLLKCYSDKRKVVVVLDNAQTKLAETAKYIDLIKRVLCSFSIGVCFTVICWDKARAVLQKLISKVIDGRVYLVSFDADSQITELVEAKHYKQYLQRILTDCKGDILIASEILRNIDGANGVYPQKKHVYESVYKQCIGNAQLTDIAIECLYIIASLGKFEIHVKKNYIDRIYGNAVGELIEKGIVRLYHSESETDSFVYLGHRSYASIIADYLRFCYGDKCGKELPEDIAVDYLKVNDAKFLHTMLERLDCELGVSDDLLVKLWQAFDGVKQNLYREVVIDPDWGENTASMVFAAEALAEISDFDTAAIYIWQKQALEIRKRWRADFGKLEFIGKPYIKKGEEYSSTSEIIDFTDNIRHAMSEDEKNNNYDEKMQSENIDYYRFHDNWLLGLLLGFEGTALDETARDNITDYIECANRMQLANGAFYPERVPWVTARVVLGLSRCGETYGNSQMVRRACNWLVSRITDEISLDDEKKLKCYGWSSGTGKWNSDVQITLMNLDAILSAGYPKTNEKIKGSLAFFKNNIKAIVPQLTNPLDIVWIFKVLSHTDVDLLSHAESIKKLTDCTVDIWGNAAITSCDKETESSDVSFMAKELLNIMWKIIRDNIKNLLSGLEHISASMVSADKDIFISYRRHEGGGGLFAQNIYNALDNIYKNDVFYDIEDLRSKAGAFSEELDRALINSKVVIVIVSDGAFSRCLENGYKIEEDVYIHEIRTAIDNNKNIIAVFNGSATIPNEKELKKKCSDCHKLAERLTGLNAVIYNPNMPKANEKMIADIIDKLTPLLI